VVDLTSPRQLGKIGRWVVKISALKFEVRHIRGTRNIIADTLSRMFENPPDDMSNHVDCNLVLTCFSLAFQDLQRLQREDAALAQVI
jgi:hypothetical protein